MHVVVLVVAGVLAGVIGSAGGITSLVSYPALLAVGLPPLSANVTNMVALVGAFPGSALGSRVELRGQGPRVRQWAPLVALGSLLGVTLLLLTPSDLFARVVPFLLALASLALVLQPRLARSGETAAPAGRVALGVGLFSVSVYAGYFGAGSGIMVLVAILLRVEDHYQRANALKNVLIGVATLVSAACFVVFGPVHFLAALALGAGAVAGELPRTRGREGRAGANAARARGGTRIRARGLAVAARVARRHPCVAGSSATVLLEWGRFARVSTRLWSP